MSTVLIAAALTALLGTFVEYWAHRMMHTGKLLRKHHARHHQQGSGQGWIWEFRDYALPTLPLYMFAYLTSGALVALGAAIGGIGFAAVAAYAHQLQHERPQDVRWMRQPQHAMHHHHREWHYNFGITVDWWDHVFGTFRAHPPITVGESGRPLTDIHWFHRAPALPHARRATVS